MVTPTTQDRLEIEVQDFGPIVHAKIDLRPMTVFIGPSNMGKSYLAILLYALHRFFGGPSEGLTGVRRVGFGRFRPWGAAGTEVSKEAIAAFDRLMEMSPDAEDGNLTLPDEIAGLLCSWFSDMGNAVGSEIARCFGLDGPAMLIRKGNINCARVVMRGGFVSDTPELEHILVLSQENTELHTTIPKRVSMSSAHVKWSDIVEISHNVRNEIARTAQDRRSSGYWSVIDLFMDAILPDMVSSLHLPAFYFPGDRTGLMHSHGAVVSGVLENTPMAGFKSTARTPLLSGVLADFLRQLMTVDRMNPALRDPGWWRPSISDADSEIEKRIIQGTIGTDRSGPINYPLFTYRPDGWKEDLPLMYASSMVSEIAPIVLFLRYLVYPGNVLIIEEPESHLHPAAQVEFTRQLAKLVQQGYRVIITTHSEWILEELANVVQRSQLPAEEVSTVSASDAALPADQVGVWLFRSTNPPEGSEVVHVPLGEAGLYDSGFDDVAMALSNDGANIFNRIGQKE